MRGILLAGGSGSRLWPITKGISKQLVPVFDKPMVYYPLSTLIMADIRDILIITTPQDRPQFERLLGDGGPWGLRLQYGVQLRPAGIAQALIIAEDFIQGEPVALILGDNIFHGPDFTRTLRKHSQVAGGHIFAYPVANPWECGVVELDADGRPLSIEEKPRRPRSRYAVPGLYFYDGSAPEIARGVRPSARGELEISTVNREYLRRGQLAVTPLDSETVWLDAGTLPSLVQASEIVRTVARCQGLNIGCVEEAAWRTGFIDDARLRAAASSQPASVYGEYLLRLLEPPAEPGRTRSGP